jgi:hypothetical protein
MKEKLFDTMLTVGSTLVSVIVGALLTEGLGFWKGRKAIQKQFNKIIQRILTTNVYNDLGEKLLELKDFFDENSDLLVKRSNNFDFYKKWILGKDLESYRGEKPVNLWQKEEVKEMIQELLKLKF